MRQMRRKIGDLLVCEWSLLDGKMRQQPINLVPNMVPPRGRGPQVSDKKFTDNTCKTKAHPTAVIRKTAGGGLYLEIKPESDGGGRHWYMAYRVNRVKDDAVKRVKTRDALGEYPAVP